MRKIRTIQDVVDWGLCVGCGACYYACDSDNVELDDIESMGIRPRFREKRCSDCLNNKLCLSICPGSQVDSRINMTLESDINTLIGSTIEVWEGYACDEEIRYNASSGGILTALSLYCLEKENMEFVLHIGMDKLNSCKNKTVQSRNKTDLLRNAGSRYAPSSPCSDLNGIEESTGKCVFIGKPCDAAAVSMLRDKFQTLDSKLGLVLSFFCAGTPNTYATKELVKKLNIHLTEVNSIRYRGEGWPGRFKVAYNNDSHETSLTYEESWHFLQKYRPFRCYLCPDGLGELADITSGDAWHHYNKNGDCGRSIILIRTNRGREIFHRALAEGYIEAIRSGPTEVIQAQGLVERRKEIFGRSLAMRLFCIPVPHYSGFFLFRLWLKVSLWRKAKTILSTIKRIIKRKLWKKKSI